jgi:hypothetical protein
MAVAVDIKPGRIEVAGQGLEPLVSLGAVQQGVAEDPGMDLDCGDTSRILDDRDLIQLTAGIIAGRSEALVRLFADDDPDRGKAGGGKKEKTQDGKKE